MTCVLCGREFTPKSPRQKFCSALCRERQMRQKLQRPGKKQSKLRRPPEVSIEEIVAQSPGAYRAYQTREQLGQRGPSLPERPEFNRAGQSAASQRECFNRCEGCVYFRSMPQYGDERCCHYMLVTGIPRGVPPRLCYRHEGTPYRPVDGEDFR